MASTATGNSLPEVGAKIEGGRNVSVTPINMSDSQMTNGQFSYSSNGVRINVPSEEQRRPLVAMDDEDSNDAEVSKIDFMQHHYQVNMRTKKKRPSSSSHASATSEMTAHSDQTSEALTLERERPMSWEGELSDSEMPVEPIQQSQIFNQQQMQQLHLQQMCNEQVHALPGRAAEEFRLKEEFRPKEEPLDVTHSFLNHHNNQVAIGRQDNAMRHHQRSHSMNRVSVLSGEIPDIRCPSSPQSQHKLSSPCPPSLPPSDQLPQSAQPLSAISPATALEQTIKNIPVNIIPTSLSNKMASEAHAYACKREQINMQQVPNQQGQTILPEIKPEVPLLVDKLLGGYSLHSTPSNSPLLNRHHKIMSNPSTDSAIHSIYTHSVYSSPSASPGATRHAPYTPSLSRNNSDASHSSCYSYSSEFSPTHSPVQGRHPIPAHAAALFRSEHGAFATSRPHHLSSVSSVCTQEGGVTSGSSCAGLGIIDPGGGGTEAGSPDPEGAEDRVHHHQGVSRQQLINSPCPICGDKISGFHYGIFSCESCKGFFKRTVQNRKNYVCLRGANCLVTVATRKKCPACRFDKCLHCGMKLEAIREDRTRGGRSTYQCSYSLSGAASTSSLLGAGLSSGPLRHASSLTSVNGPSSHLSYHSQHDLHTASLGGSSHGMSLGLKSEPGSHTVHSNNMAIPPLLQEIMDVEHLWQYNESELTKLNKGQALGSGNQSSSSAASMMNNPLLKAAGVSADSNPDFLANLCNIADHRLYKIVKWCKSLPLFKNISIDDQICLLINSWCELLVLSCCYRGVSTPGEVRVGGGSRGITLEQSGNLGLTPCIERMLHFTDHLRRLRVDRYEYVAMKVIVLLTSDISELKQPEKVRESQEKALQALQAYTLAHYPETPAKFGELLLRLPELQRTCQVGKELLNPTSKSKDGETPSFNLLMELLRGDH